VLETDGGIKSGGRLGATVGDQSARLARHTNAHTNSIRSPQLAPIAERQQS